MLVVAAIAIVMILIDGFKTGRVMQSAGDSIRYVINHQGIGDAVERRVANWDEKHRRYANAIFDVFDPHTNFDWTDLDDDIKAWYIDKFDGVVEPPEAPGIG